MCFSCKLLGDHYFSYSMLMTFLTLFADDTKLYTRIKDQDDCNSLQQDLNALGAWSQKWLLKFNETKCVVLKIHSAINYVYTLNGMCLSGVDSQKT